MGRGLVKFDQERCKGCCLCVSVCPVKIIEMNTLKINSKGYHTADVLDIDQCIGCGNCAIICPDGAISVYIK
jgi:2-oxoglutarate ferredoxin oxidoreductase subunit delta